MLLQSITSSFTKIGSCQVAICNSAYAVTATASANGVGGRPLGSAPFCGGFCGQGSNNLSLVWNFWLAISVWMPPAAACFQRHTAHTPSLPRRRRLQHRRRRHLHLQPAPLGRCTRRIRRSCTRHRTRCSRHPCGRRRSAAAARSLSVATAVV